MALTELRHLPLTVTIRRLHGVSAVSVDHEVTLEGQHFGHHPTGWIPMSYDDGVDAGVYLDQFEVGQHSLDVVRVEAFSQAWLNSAGSGRLIRRSYER